MRPASDLAAEASVSEVFHACLGRCFQVVRYRAVCHGQVAVVNEEIIVGNVHSFGTVYLTQGYGYRLGVAHQRKCIVGITFGRDVKRRCADGVPKCVQRQVAMGHRGEAVAQVLMCQRYTEVVYPVSGIGCRPGEVCSGSGLQLVERTLLGYG